MSDIPNQPLVGEEWTDEQVPGNTGIGVVKIVRMTEGTTWYRRDNLSIWYTDTDVFISKFQYLDPSDTAWLDEPLTDEEKQSIIKALTEDKGKEF